MRKANIGLGALQAFISLGAIGGGLLLVIDPSGSTLGVPPTLLEGTIFHDFLIPGLFLLIVNGLGSLTGAVLTFTVRKYAQEAAVGLGAVLVLWIVIQVGIIQSLGFLHVLYFILGMLELLLGLYIRRHRLRAA